MSDKYHIPFDDAPEHAAALGRLVAHWNVLERILVILLQWLLSTSWLKSLLVFQQFASFPGKIGVLRTLNYHFNKHDHLKNEVDKHLKTALGYNDTRIQFVHALWGVKVGDKIVRTPSFEPTNPRVTSQHIYGEFSPQDIQAEVDKIAKLSQKFSDILDQLGAKTAVGLKIHVSIQD